MISMRQHAISLIAVFLALALTGTDRDKIGNLEDERDSLSSQVNSDNAFISAISGRITAGLLKSHSVLVVTTPDAGEADVDALKTLINDADGEFAGQIALTQNLLSDQNAAKLRTVIDQSIPAGAQLRIEYTDSGSRLGDLLGVATLHRDGQKPTPAADRDTALEALRGGEFIDYPTGTIKPADLVLVVTGGEMPKDSGAQGQLVARLAATMAMRAQGGALVGREGSAEGGSPIGVIRSDPSLGNAVTTVDDVQLEMGRLTTILALDEEAKGRSGAFGTGPGATAITVGAKPAE